MKIIDAHSHIDYITHNFQSDVVGTVCCTTKESEWNVLINMIKDDNRIYGAFGIHPWFVTDINDDFDLRLENILKTNRNFMVGEIGLDKYKPDMDKQILIFQKQLDIAIRFNRTVFLHCVGAWDKILHILKQYKPYELPIIVAHDFNGSSEILKYLLQNYNVMFSIHNIDKQHEICRIQQIPFDKILAETDAKQNVVLHDIIDKIAVIKKEPNICDIIYNNTLKVLNNE